MIFDKKGKQTDGTDNDTLQASVSGAAGTRGPRGEPGAPRLVCECKASERRESIRDPPPTPTPSLTPTTIQTSKNSILQPQVTADHPRPGIFVPEAKSAAPLHEREPAGSSSASRPRLLRFNEQSPRNVAYSGGRTHSVAKSSGPLPLDRRPHKAKEPASSAASRKQSQVAVDSPAPVAFLGDTNLRKSGRKRPIIVTQNVSNHAKAAEKRKQNIVISANNQLPPVGDSELRAVYLTKKRAKPKSVAPSSTAPPTTQNSFLEIRRADDVESFEELSYKRFFSQK